jgi:hypothetical protein
VVGVAGSAGIPGKNDANNFPIKNASNSGSSGAGLGLGLGLGYMQGRCTTTVLFCHSK